jgi:mannose-1-phosphate guanylyltransferase
MLWAVIMAGGSGTRFWPESRAKKPKQFLPIFGEKTLFEQTLDRVKSLIPASRALVVTNQAYVPQVRKLCKVPSSQIIGEPVGRNTAPCTILAAALIAKKDPEAILDILPSDHRIGKEPLFRASLQAASEIAAREGLPVTFGMKPTQAHTGYGYLEMDEPFTKHKKFQFYRLKRFHEKPNQDKAEHFLKAGNFLWNSGMFVWRADKLLEAAKKFLPEAYNLSLKMSSGNFQKQLKRDYSKMPNISIDYALMEKLTGQILTLPIDLDWHDLGGWPAFSELWQMDAKKNVIQGNALVLEGSGNIVKAGKKLVATLGVHDLVIVDTDDALLICPKEQSESIRKIVAALKEKKLERYL